MTDTYEFMLFWAGEFGELSYFIPQQLILTLNELHNIVFKEYLFTYGKCFY